MGESIRFMARTKTKMRKKKDAYQRTIPKYANPIRFLIFLAVGMALFCVFMYFVITRGGL
ncbi:MAG: hypothetical protein C4532_01955 [Candidatus Abyssobacteria bacterium SURF_17]|jgi:hypothetical protein|uniref:Uncharacterized protein n=1 Tax=Candidatus Abyssobacteria bacterium SURF_17 TaxID=2093361 RepID=A0A419F865_9BACT|nr:MAG: hypothetical protein C4532_01955 [Candidatus Abyssubacteria bacterium SURF_17]